MRSIALLLIAFLSYSNLSCSSEAKSETPENGEDQEEAIAIPVETSSVSRGDISAFFVGTATLEARDEASVVSKATGIVENIYVEEGNYVKKGQALARLDSERSALEVVRLKATLSQTENEFNRQKDLFEKKLVSAKEYDQIRYNYESQKAQLELSELQLQYATIRAPIAGVIAERKIKVGNMVSTNAPTFEIVDFTPLHAIVYVPEKELSKLDKGQEVVLRLDATAGEPVSGKVLRISPVVDATSGTFRTTIEIPNRDRKLKPGMLASVQIEYSKHLNALLVPKEAILIEDSDRIIFVVRDDTAHRMLIGIGYEDNQNVEVISGLDEGEQIITIGQGALSDSSAVEIIK